MWVMNYVWADIHNFYVITELILMPSYFASGGRSMRLHTQHSRVRKLRRRVPHAGGGRRGIVVDQTGTSCDGALDEVRTCTQDCRLYWLSASGERTNYEWARLRYVYLDILTNIFRCYSSWNIACNGTNIIFPVPELLSFPFCRGRKKIKKKVRFGSTSVHKY